jgi:hypothetical protein
MDLLVCDKLPFLSCIGVVSHLSAIKTQSVLRSTRGPFIQATNIKLTSINHHNTEQVGCCLTEIQNDTAARI